MYLFHLFKIDIVYEARHMKIIRDSRITEKNEITF